jgi:NDP-sugar pyrophosphorylase family protein
MNTGGGLRQALPLLGDAPFLSINADILWDADLRPLLRAFDPARMTALLALTPNPSHARGDFRLLPDGCLERAPGASDSLTYTGIQIMQPDALRPYPVAPFSVNSLYDRAISDGTLVGQPLEGRWMDIGTHERLTQAHSRWRIRNQTPVPEWAPCPAR